MISKSRDLAATTLCQGKDKQKVFKAQKLNTKENHENFSFVTPASFSSRIVISLETTLSLFQCKGIGCVYIILL